MKKLFIVLLLPSLLLAQEFKFGAAKGLFMGIGVGPRFPVGGFSDTSNIGVGNDVTFSQHYPGRQDFYKRTDYSSFSSNVLVLAPGVRYYFPPLIESVMLLMPVVDAGLSFAYFEKSHQFKLDRGKQNYVEETGKFGFHIGAGFSMFILDVITYYNFLNNNEYISFNLRATIPIFVTF